MVAEHYGIHRVEFQHTDFPSTESAYFQEFRSRMKKAKSQMNQINLEFANLNISSPDPVIRLETIDLTRRWIDYAVALDCPRVMVNQGDLAPGVRQTAIETLKTIHAYAKTKNVSVTMENRGAPWDVVVEVIKASGIRANPDCGNFPDKESRAAGISRHVQADRGQQPCPAHPGEIRHGRGHQDFERGGVQRACIRSKPPRATSPIPTRPCRPLWIFCSPTSSDRGVKF